MPGIDYIPRMEELYMLSPRERRDGPRNKEWKQKWTHMPLISMTRPQGLSLLSSGLCRVGRPSTLSSHTFARGPSKSHPVILSSLCPGTSRRERTYCSSCLSSSEGGRPVVTQWGQAGIWVQPPWALRCSCSSLRRAW